MLHSNGQRAIQNKGLTCSTDDTRHVSKVQVSLTPSQAEFIDLIMCHDVLELSRSLKLIHDFALYHTDIPFDEEEKSALYNLKVLWEGLEQMEEKN